MARGSDTPQNWKDAFRAEYLICGNASLATRRVNERLGMDVHKVTSIAFAQEYRKDPTFVQSRTELRDSALSELVAMRMDTAREAHRLAFEEPQVIPLGEGQSAYVDKRSEFMRNVSDAEKLAHGLAKIEAGNVPNAGEGITVLIKGVVQDPDSMTEPNPSKE